MVSPMMVLILPARQYQLRRQRVFHPIGTEEPTSLSWADIRTSRLLDSGISGGLTGGILNTWKRMPGLLKLVLTFLIVYFRRQTWSSTRPHNGCTDVYTPSVGSQRAQHFPNTLCLCKLDRSISASITKFHRCRAQFTSRTFHICGNATHVG